MVSAGRGNGEHAEPSHSCEERHNRSGSQEEGHKRALKTEQQILLLYGTSAGSSKKGPDSYLVRVGGMCAGQKRTNSAAKEHVHLQNYQLQLIR